MLDYKGIEALQVVQELQSFEAAAKKLYITQSAVSQRIKGLETSYGEPVLIRTLPYRLTKLGEELIAHYKRVCMLEDDLQVQLDPTKAIPQISIALNRDSLETWFLDLIEESALFNKILLKIIVEDQEFTINYLKNGLVSACISTSSKEIIGGTVHFLGNMEYVLAATPQFKEKYFCQKEFPYYAPAIKFDKNDHLHDIYLEKFFNLRIDELKFHYVPSVKGFKSFILSGFGYGLIPKIDILDELMTNQLTLIYPEKTLKIPHYWHHWAIQSKFYREMNTQIIQHIIKKFKSFDSRFK